MGDLLHLLLYLSKLLLALSCRLLGFFHNLGFSILNKFGVFETALQALQILFQFCLLLL